MDRSVNNQFHPIAQGDGGGRQHHFVRILMLTGLAFENGHCARVEDAELALQPRLRSFLASQLLHQGVRTHGDAGDLISGQAMLVAQLHTGVDGGMDHDAARKRFVGVERDFPAGAQVLGDLGPVGFVREHLHQAPWRFQGTARCGKAMARQQCRHQTGFGRSTGVKGFGHGAKLLTQAHRL